MILAGDIGGTKTLLALFDPHGKCVSKQQFSSMDYEQFEDLLKVFLLNNPVKDLNGVCLGVAGPIVEGDCMTTNLPWCLKRIKIAEIARVKKVHLLNDLQAMAWGILNLPETDFVWLNKCHDKNPEPGNIAVLAAGTGLGEAVISWDGINYHVISTEGGHVDYAPTDELEIKLFRCLRQKYGGHVSYERVVSGMGLIDVYEFLKTIDYFSVSSETEALFEKRDRAEVISSRALRQEDGLCVKTMQLFCRNYGAEAGNLALKSLPYGGVVLAGGIAAKNIPILMQGDFMRGFLEKGRYRELLQKIPVKVCMNHDAALIGAAEFSSRLQG